ncbi:hypothetical protein B0H16DRAFT_1638022 [Mycena metata]|uniref:Uncharacterized protein n=1 Tax=Mycena metata TaxID=1033252 RepID=A0AAD7GSC5_9AGAR|nr:hypothetical protein B0H16DRAFT_1638022 [Mycena metata]
MKALSSLFIFIQVAVSGVSALPVEAATSAETRRNDHQHVPFFKYPAVEEANDIRRSPLEYVPFVNYPGDSEHDETDSDTQNVNEERGIHRPCGRSTPSHCKPFVHYPDELEANSEDGKQERAVGAPPFVHYPTDE